MPVNNQTVLDKPANGATETHPTRPTPDNPEKGVTYREYTHTEYNALIAANMEKHHASIRKKNNPLGRLCASSEKPDWSRFPVRTSQRCGDT